MISSVLEIWHNKFDQIKLISEKINGYFASIEADAQFPSKNVSNMPSFFQESKPFDFDRPSMMRTRPPSPINSKINKNDEKIDRLEATAKFQSDELDEKLRVIARCKLTRRRYG